MPRTRPWVSHSRAQACSSTPWAFHSKAPGAPFTHAGCSAWAPASRCQVRATPPGPVPRDRARAAAPVSHRPRRHRHCTGRAASLRRRAVCEPPPQRAGQVDAQRAHAHKVVRGKKPPEGRDMQTRRRKVEVGVQALQPASCQHCADMDGQKTPQHQAGEHLDALHRPQPLGRAPGTPGSAAARGHLAQHGQQQYRFHPRVAVNPSPSRFQPLPKRASALW